MINLTKLVILSIFQDNEMRDKQKWFVSDKIADVAEKDGGLLAPTMEIELSEDISLTEEEQVGVGVYFLQAWSDFIQGTKSSIELTYMLQGSSGLCTSATISISHVVLAVLSLLLVFVGQVLSWELTGESDSEEQ